MAQNPHLNTVPLRLKRKRDHSSPRSLGDATFVSAPHYQPQLASSQPSLGTRRTIARDKHRHRSYEEIEQNNGNTQMGVSSSLQASANMDVDEDMVQKAFQVARYLDQCSKSGYGQAKLIHDLTKQKDEARETWVRLATELEEMTKQRDDAQENLVQLAGDLQSMTWQRDEARARCIGMGRYLQNMAMQRDEARIRCRQLYTDLRAVGKEKREIERSEEILATELRNLAKQTSRAAKEKEKDTCLAKDLKDMTMQRDQALKEKADIVTMYNSLVQEILHESDKWLKLFATAKVKNAERLFSLSASF